MTGPALHRRQLLAAGGAAMLAACARTPGGVATAPAARPSRLRPLLLDPARVEQTLVCLRPFRAAGPRLELERIGEKAVVHNYGHGGSGWSLSWGCADEAAALVRSLPPGPVAVVGAGVIGMTTAIRLAESGFPTTIYAADFGLQTRSARATGVWSPSSRIAMESAAGAAFPERWEAWARRSFVEHYAALDQPLPPVEFLPQYNIAGRTEPPIRSQRDWLHLDRRLAGLMSPWRDIEADNAEFPGRDGRTGLTMAFDIARYFNLLRQRFAATGGALAERRFGGRADILSLSEATIINCMGYGARETWGDAGVIHVRGQVAHLPPQPEARYAVYHDAVQAVSRRDALVVQYLGVNDDWGYGEAGETPDPAETRLALSRLRPLFA